MDIHEHGAPHSANEIACNIWQFGSLSKWHLLEKIFWSPFSSRLGLNYCQNKDINWFYIAWNAWPLDKICVPAISSIFKCLFLLNSCNFWSFQDAKGRKMVLKSLNVYVRSHPLSQMSFYVSRHRLPVRTLEAAIPLALWKVSLRWHSAGCCQIQTTQCNSLDLILMRLPPEFSHRCAGSPEQSLFAYMIRSLSHDLAKIVLLWVWDKLWLEILFYEGWSKK